jgi:hypothetical protein
MPVTDAPEWGITSRQESKYQVCRETGRIVNRETGEAIPDDEPIIILRAKDVHAAPTIRRYVDLVNEARGSKPSVHMDSCFGRYQSFVEFARAHPQRMKQPD